MQLVTGVINSVQTIEPQPRNVGQPKRLTVTCSIINDGPVCFDITYDAALSLASRINRELFPGPIPMASFQSLPPGQIGINQPAEDFKIFPSDGPIPCLTL